MIVTEVVEKATRSLENLKQAIEDIDPQTMAIPNTIGAWSVKDVMNHLIVWDEEAAKAFEIWKVGIEPDWSYIDDLDEFNNKTVAERRKVPLSKIKNQLELVHGGVLENLKSVSDDEFNRRGGIPKWLIILLTKHIDDHAARIAEYKKSLNLADQKSA
jgi:hypothetical protein